MLPDPLHPAVVHLPIALAILMPFFALGAIAAIASGFASARAWWVVVVLQLVLAGSAWFAAETGHDEEERVEKVMEERHIEEHEEAADWMVRVAVAGALLMALGLAPGRGGRIGRVAGLLAALVVLATAMRTGHLGGELVYRHGAANAYTAPAPAP
jgi:uncharacterized membrane protein